MCSTIFEMPSLLCYIFIHFVVEVSMTTKEPNRMYIIYDILVHLILRFQSFVPLCVLCFTSCLNGSEDSFPTSQTELGSSHDKHCPNQYIQIHCG